MAITLNSTLATALSGSSHHPICKIFTSDQVAEIPFDGNYFDTYTETQRDLSILNTTQGRIATLYVQNQTLSDYDLYYKYTDTERQVWTTEKIYDTAGDMMDAAMVEMPDGNIGVAVVDDPASPDIRRLIISPTGDVVSSVSTVATYGTGTTVDGIAVASAGTGYIMIYAREAEGDPSSYYLTKHTGNASFSGWSAASDLSISGISSTYKINRPNLTIADSGRLLLFFDYVDQITDDTERYNIYYCYSVDNGASWSAAIQVTGYTEYTNVAQHPSVAEKADGDLVIAYHEKISVLKINENTTGYCVDDSFNEGNDGLSITRLDFNESTRKLFVQNFNQGPGEKPLRSILVVDVDTWTIDRCYKQNSPPGWNNAWGIQCGGVWGCGCAKDNWVIVPADFFLGFGFMILNHQSESVKELWWHGQESYGITSNIDLTQLPLSTSWQDEFSYDIDATNQRVYCAIGGEYAVNWSLMVCYFDLNCTPDPLTGLYSPTMVWTSDFGGEDFACGSGEHLCIRVYPDEDKIIISGSAVAYGDSYAGYLIVLSLSTGSHIKTFHWTDGNGFPKAGVVSPVLIGNKIYSGLPEYWVTYGQENIRGLIICDYVSGAVTYQRPTYITVNHYRLVDLRRFDNNTKISMGSLHGAVIYDVINQTFTLYNNDNVPGMFSQDPDYQVCGQVVVDEAANRLYTGHIDSYAVDDNNLLGIPLSGSLYQSKYISGALQGDDSYSFAGTTTLTVFYGTYEPSITYDADQSLWATWTYHDFINEEISVQWDRAGFSPELGNYLLSNSAVNLTWELERPASAEFTLARGDLFDPTNQASTLSPILKKGRLVEISLGENVNGSPYWQSQGMLVITGVAISYARKDHPTITVTAEDQTLMWPEIVVTATQGYIAADPDNIFIELLEDIANLEPTEHSIPDNISTYHPVYMQWVDETLENIISDLHTHFGTYGTFRADGKYTVRKIDPTASVDHDYSGISNLKIMNFSPDDRNTSFVNRIVVKCESRTFIEVLWDEERIDEINGTLGWWSREKEIYFPFSGDNTRRCRNPRLEVLESINDFSPLINFLGGKGNEYISFQAPNETYIIITIEGPNRAIYVFAFAAAVVGFGIASIGCDGPLWGWCYVYIMATNLALGALIEVLSAVANYRYAIHARPVGHEKEMLQGSADDTEFQNELGGLVVTEEFDDPLSYTVQHCQMVASQELNVVKYQRRRLRFEKTAHLQDELGDIVQVDHPISGIPMRVFVTRLVREFICPTFESQGSFMDRIEGWRLSS